MATLFEKDDASINDILKKLGIFELKDKYPSKISGGEKQRASIASLWGEIGEFGPTFGKGS